MCAVTAIRDLCRSGMAANEHGDHAAADFYLHQALRQAQGRKSPVLEAKILNTMGVLALTRGRQACAVAPFTQALHKVEARIGRENVLYRVISNNLAQAQKEVSAG